MTVFTWIFQNQLQLFFTSMYCLFKRNADSFSDIGTFHRTITGSASSGTSEQISKDISENVSKISSIKSAAKSTCTSGTSLKCRVAELIILTTFVSVTQNGIGFRSLFELFLSFFISRIHIRMVLLCKLTICFFYCSIIGILTYAEYFIIISFCLCHNTTTLPFYNLKKFYEAIFLQLRRILYSSYFSDVNLSDYMDQIKPLCNLRLLHHHLQNFPVPDLLPV